MYSKFVNRPNWTFTVNSVFVVQSIRRLQFVEEGILGAFFKKRNLLVYIPFSLKNKLLIIIYDLCKQLEFK